MDVSWLSTTLLVALVGGGVVPWLTARGYRHLSVTAVSSRRSLASSVAAGLVAGAAGSIAARQAGTWWALPALLAWAYVIAAAACCDAVCQRIPTPLVRRGAAVVAVLLTVCAVASGNWHALLVAFIAASLSALVLACCWRFAGLGFGDVRLGLLGGLALGHVTEAGLFAAFAAFTLIALGQVVFTLTHGGSRHSHIAVGPALAAALLVGAAA